MAYCQNVGTNLDANPTFCLNCGVALNDVTAEQANQDEQIHNRQSSDTAKTLGTVAGVAAGAC